MNKCSAGSDQVVVLTLFDLAFYETPKPEPSTVYDWEDHPEFWGKVRHRKASKDLSVDPSSTQNRSTDSSPERSTDSFCQVSDAERTSPDMSVDQKIGAFRSTDIQASEACEEMASEESQSWVSVDPSVGTDRGSGWIEQYHPANRRTKYFRYGWLDKKVRFRHLCGGNITNPLAIARAGKVQQAIARGKSPKQILELIASW